MNENLRIQTGIERGRAVEIKVNGKTVYAYAGETVGAALAASGIRRIRRSPHGRDHRGLYCCMGMCHACLVTVDGQANVRACFTPVRPGQQIVLQDGFGRFDMEQPGPSPGRLLREQVPIVVIGGGPAGLCAAVAAARAGAQVLVIDENLLPGGQIYRQIPRTFNAYDTAILGSDFADGRSLLRDVAAFSDRIRIWNDASVWSVFESKQLAVARNNDLILLDAGAIVIATGAYDRPFPVPGWTLPGVMTAGGSQILLKSQRIRPGHRILLAGTGPLQLVVANQMLDAGIEVIAVVEAAHLSDSWRYLSDLSRQPKLMLQGLKYIYRLRRAGVPLLQRTVLKAIEGDAQVESAVVEKVDSRGYTVPGQAKTFAADTVSMGYGLIPRIRISQMLGCKHIYTPLVGGWVPHFDENMQTSRAGIFVAGDGAGVAGVMAAQRQGTLAGLFAAVGSGIVSSRQAEQSAVSIRKQLTSIGRFRSAMDRIYPVCPVLYARVTDDTIVCRCEGVTAGAIRKAIHDGTPDLNDIKKRTRAGMGYCQGANCMPVIAAILTREFNIRPEEIPVMTNRPPAGPLPLHLLMVDPESV